MKLGIVLLLLLGVVAAACAAVLVSGFKLNALFGADPNDVARYEVVVAREFLPAMTIVTADHIEKKVVTKADLPKDRGRLFSHAAAIGRVLAVPAVKDEVLTEFSFVQGGTGAELAAKLAEGMRAYTLHMRTGVPDRVLLYPGCFVDILFTSKLSSRDPRGEAIATPLLEEIQVLAVAGESVITHTNSGETKAAPRNNSSRGLAVTLLVNSRQAAALQLAIENGIISLVVRNPLDKKRGDREPMVLSQGQLADLASVMMLEDLAREKKEGDSEPTDSADSGTASPEEPTDSVDSGTQSRPEPAGQNAKQPDKQPKEAAAAAGAVSAQPIAPAAPNETGKSNRRRAITVIRGSNSKVEELTIPKDNDPGDNTDQ